MLTGISSTLYILDHHDIIITLGLQEWACLLPQELPFASVARLLRWQAHDATVLSDAAIRSLVRTHGQIIRQAEAADVAALTARDDLATAELNSCRIRSRGTEPDGQPN